MGRATPSLTLGLRADLGPVAEQPSAPPNLQKASALSRTLKAPSAGTGHHRCPFARRPGSPQGQAPRYPEVSSWPSAGLRCWPTRPPLPCWRWAPQCGLTAAPARSSRKHPLPTSHQPIAAWQPTVSMATGFAQRSEKQSFFLILLNIFYYASSMFQS